MLHEFMTVWPHHSCKGLWDGALSVGLSAQQPFVVDLFVGNTHYNELLHIIAAS